MAMLDSCSLEVSSASDQNSVESFEAHHHFITHIENQFVLQLSNPPSVLHDPIAWSLKESYVVSIAAKQKKSYFFMFAFLRSSKFCACMSITRNVSRHHDIIAKCLSCAFRGYFSVCIFKI